MDRRTRVGMARMREEMCEKSTRRMMRCSDSEPQWVALESFMGSGSAGRVLLKVSSLSGVGRVLLNVSSLVYFGSVLLKVSSFSYVGRLLWKLMLEEFSLLVPSSDAMLIGLHVSVCQVIHKE